MTPSQPSFPSVETQSQGILKPVFRGKNQAPFFRFIDYTLPHKGAKDFSTRQKWLSYLEKDSPITTWIIVDRCFHKTLYLRKEPSGSLENFPSLEALQKRRYEKSPTVFGVQDLSTSTRPTYFIKERTWQDTLSWGLIPSYHLRTLTLEEAQSGEISSQENPEWGKKALAFFLGFLLISRGRSFSPMARGAGLAPLFPLVQAEVNEEGHLLHPTLPYEQNTFDHSQHQGTAPIEASFSDPLEAQKVAAETIFQFFHDPTLEKIPGIIQILKTGRIINLHFTDPNGSLQMQFPEFQLNLATASALTKIGTQWMKVDLKKAQAFTELALEFYLHLEGAEESIEKAQTLAFFAEILHNSEEDKKYAEPYLLAALGILKTHYGTELSKDHYRPLIQLCILYQEKKEQHKAHLCQEQLAFIINNLFDKDEEEKASGFQTLGVLAHASGDVEKAIFYNEKALKLLPESSPARISCYAAKSVYLQQLGKYEEALLSLEKSLDPPTAVGISQIDLLTGWVTKAVILKNLEHLDDAIKAYETALALHDQLYKGLRPLEKAHLLLEYAKVFEAKYPYPHTRLTPNLKEDREKWEEALEQILSLVPKYDVNRFGSYPNRLYLQSLSSLNTLLFHNHKINKLIPLIEEQVVLARRSLRGTSNKEETELVMLSLTACATIYWEIIRQTEDVSTKKKYIDLTGPLMQESLLLAQALYGEETNLYVLKQQQILFSFFYENDQFTEALHYAKQLLDGVKKVFGDIPHPDHAQALEQFGKLYAKIIVKETQYIAQKAYLEQIRDFYTQALQMYQRLDAQKFSTKITHLDKELQAIKEIFKQYARIDRKM